MYKQSSPFSQSSEAPQSSLEEKNTDQTAVEEPAKEERETQPPLVEESLQDFCLGRCCMRESCYFATPLLKMRYCPYCSQEMRTVYDFFAMFHISPSEPFSQDLAKPRYKQLSYMFHPDKKEDDLPKNEFLLVTEGWQILCDDLRRREYRLMLSKCRTSLMMEEGPKQVGDEPQPKTDEPKRHRIANFVLASIFSLSSVVWIAKYFGDVWMSLAGVAVLFFSTVFFSHLHKIISLVMVASMLFSFFYFLLQEKWVMTSLLLFALVGLLHFYKWWHTSTVEVPAQEEPS